ncbi:MAG UNVERIFIED_CONTAM: hypothetical protein LVR29_15075 [Microcystis novacekii LVE1205-3]
MRTINRDLPLLWKNGLSRCCQQLLELMNIPTENDSAIITQPSLRPVKIAANWEFLGKKVDINLLTGNLSPE